jgi:hypothetical protein
MTSFLIVSLVFFLLWLGLLFFSHNTRREQIIMSVVGAIMAPGIISIVAEDYRNIVSEHATMVGIEDFIFAFSLFGIAAVLYQAVLGKHLHKMRGQRVQIKHPVLHMISHLILVLAIWAFIALLLIYIFSLTSIMGLIVGGAFIGIYIIADRHDLMFNALITGLALALLVFLVEQFFFVRLHPVDAMHFWQWDAVSTFMIGGVPTEELVWAAVVGFTIGPMYEWLKRYELK